MSIKIILTVFFEFYINTVIFMSRSVVKQLI